MPSKRGHEAWKEKREQEGWAVTISEHELPGVTPDMMDWWFDNMDKGYFLWHPNDHKSFEWAVPPGKVGHVGAILTPGQGRPGGPITKGRSRREDVSFVPAEMIIYDHVEVNTNIDANNKNTGGYIVHQYEATDYGTRLRSISVRRAVPGARVEADPGKHLREEMQRAPQFIPDLYKLWQVVTDREVNPHFCLKVKKLRSGKFAYVEKVKL